MGQEPDPQKMPLDPTEFPEEVQVAFFIISLLSDRWEGMSGSYLGKDYTNVQYLFNLYEIDNPSVIFYFMKMYDAELMAHRAEEADKKQKAAERKASAGGKNYTHNVKG